MDVTEGSTDRQQDASGLMAWDARGLAGESAYRRADSRANRKTNIWTSNVAWAIGLCAGE
jgi:hypothetical protein